MPKGRRLKKGEYINDLAVNGKWTCVYTSGEDREIPFPKNPKYFIEIFNSEQEAKEFAKAKIKITADVYGYNFVNIFNPDCEEVAHYEHEDTSMDEEV